MPMMGFLNDRHSRVFVSCSQALLSDDQKTNECLHQIPMDTLISWRQQKVREIMATRGNCDDCTLIVPEKNQDHQDNNQPQTTIDEKIKKMNILLAAKQISSLNVCWVDELSWQAQYQLSQQQESASTNRHDKGHDNKRESDAMVLDEKKNDRSVDFKRRAWLQGLFRRPG